MLPGAIECSSVLSVLKKDKQLNSKYVKNLLRKPHCKLWWAGLQHTDLYTCDVLAEARANWFDLVLIYVRT